MNGFQYGAIKVVIDVDLDTVKEREVCHTHAPTPLSLSKPIAQAWT